MSNSPVTSQNEGIPRQGAVYNGYDYMTRVRYLVYLIPLLRFAYLISLELMNEQTV